MMKRVWSFLLCLVMTLSLIAGFSVFVIAKEISEDSNVPEAILEDEKGAGSSFGEATDISVNTVVTDNLESSSDKNYYKFTIDSDGYVSFGFSHGYVDGEYIKWVLDFYNIDQDKFFNMNYYGNVDESKVITTQNVGVAAGTYYVCIHPYGSNYSDVQYNMTVNYTQDSSWESEFNDKISMADNIQINRAYCGSIISSSDYDYYRFQISEPGYVKILFNHDYVDGNYIKWIVELYDDDEKKMIDYFYYGNVLEEKVEETCNVGLSEGKYYIRIRPYGSNASFVNYKFSVDFTSASNYETEWNNLISTADKLKAGETVMGNQMTSDDKDYYCFESNNAGNVLISFAHDYVDGNYKKWIVKLIDINEKEVWSEEIYGNGTDTYQKTSQLDAGKYYVCVSPYGSNYSIVPYYLTVDFDDSGDGKSQTMYRLYNPNSGEHFYTSSIAERNNLTGVGWKYEGVAWHAPFESGVPVYRLYNPNTGDHHYTTVEGERDMLSAAGWSYEGIGWYSDESEAVALYRLYNPNTSGAGSHHYTTNMDEVNSLTNMGWQYEGVGWYGV